MSSYNILKASAAALLLTVPGVSVAQIVLTPTEVDALISLTNSFEGVLDGTLSGEVVRFKILGPRNFTYQYLKSGKVYTFERAIDRAGGSPTGNPTLNFKQPDGHEVRFEWADRSTIKFEYWEPGRRAGAQRNNPAMAKTMLTIAANTAAAPAPAVTPQRKQERQEAVSLLPVGKYTWAPFNTTLTMKADGGFQETGPRVNSQGFFIKSGNELCFDIVNGNCYTVIKGAKAGEYALVSVAKLMQSKDNNRNVGKRTTLSATK